MSLQRFVISDARILCSGADGGHRYLVGHCDWSGDLVDVAVLMRDKSEETKLTEGTVIVNAIVSDYTPGAGLLLYRAEIN